MSRPLFVVAPLVLGAILACGGEPAPAPPAPDVPIPPAPEAPAAAPAAPAPAAGIDGRAIVTATPVATDAAGFLATEAGITAPGTDMVNEMSGEVYGKSYPLPAEKAIRGVPCGAADGLSVFTDGTWACTLAGPWASGGAALAAGQNAQFWIGNAHIQRLPIAEGTTVEVGGVPCTFYARFDATGALTSCNLSRPHTFVGGVSLPADAEVTLAGDKVRGAYLMSPGSVNGKAYEAAWAFEFDDAGKITMEQEQPGD